MKNLEKIIGTFVNSKYSDYCLQVLKFIVVIVSVLFIYNFITKGFPVFR